VEAARQLAAVGFHSPDSYGFDSLPPPLLRNSNCFLLYTLPWLNGKKRQGINLGKARPRKRSNQKVKINIPFQHRNTIYAIIIKLYFVSEMLDDPFNTESTTQRGQN
jgi:hypothetical protein